MRFLDGRRPTGLAVLAAAWSRRWPWPAPLDAQVLYGSLVGNVVDSSQARGARRDRDPHQHEHQPRARGHDQ